MSGSTEKMRQRFWRELYLRGKERGFLSGEQVLPKGPYLMPREGRIKSGYLFAYLAWINRPETAVELYIAFHQRETKRIFDFLHEKKM